MEYENVLINPTWPHREAGLCISREKVPDAEIEETNEEKQSLREVSDQRRDRRIYYSRDGGNNMKVKTVQT